MLTTRTLTALTLLIGCTLATGCGSLPNTAGSQALMDQEADNTVQRFKQHDPTLNRFFDESYAYAVFPSIGKGAFLVGGAYGQGAYVERPHKVVGYCSVSQGTIGLQAGGQAYSEIIFFNYREAADYFKTGNFAFAAQASAVLVTAGAASKADYDRGVAIFVLPSGGLMFEASIGGQQFTYEPKVPLEALADATASAQP